MFFSNFLDFGCGCRKSLNFCFARVAAAATRKKKTIKILPEFGRDILSQVGVLRELRLPQLENKICIYLFSRSLVSTMLRAAARLKPLRRRAPVGGHQSLGATFLVS